jgi:plastocyanin
MSPRSIRWTVIAAFVAVVVALPVAGSAADSTTTAARGKAKVIRVGDDFFAPNSVHVGRGRVISWVWSGRNKNTHNVRLRRAPGGVAKSRFRSPSRRRNFRFSRRMGRPGRYVFVCSFHAPEMRLVVRVRR